jgi:peptidoglycan/xylan/chitin deacetylase (PgdA/CDA1 family)
VRHRVNLCFHGIGTPRRELEPGEDVYWIKVDLFLSILDDASTWPSVQLSFDDGNVSDFEIGLPALTERGLRADFFVLSDRLDRGGSLESGQVRELSERGMTIGSHGAAHRPWPGMDAATQEMEFVLARERLADVAAAPVDMAACPLGRYDRRVLWHLRRLGYQRVFTSDRRPAFTSAWLQPRYSVRHIDTPESLRAEIMPGLAERMRLEAVGLAKRLR